MVHISLKREEWTLSPRSCSVGGEVLQLQKTIQKSENKKMFKHFHEGMVKASLRAPDGSFNPQIF